MGLFRAKIEPRCVYCKYGVSLEKSDDIGCVRHGVVEAWSHCRSFRYDPLKRVPVKPVKLRKNYTEEDFQL